MTTGREGDGSPVGQPARLGRGLLVIALAMAVMNLGTYGFTLIAARLLGPREYGALAAVMGLLLIVNVVSLGLQATGARRVSAEPEDLDRIEGDVMRATYQSALAVGVICLAAIPLVTYALRLDDWLIAGMIAVTAIPLTLMGGQAGILQGERRWLPLAGIYLAVGIGRVGFGTAALLLRPDTLTAMTGVALGAVLPVLVGGTALRSGARVADRAVRAAGGALEIASSRRVLRELVHNSHALLAFFALSNADVIIARVMLAERQAGLYAGGLILAKAVLFLPQFVVVVAFPSMSAAGSRTSTTVKALAMVAGIGAVATSGAWLLPQLTIQFVGGDAYDDLAPTIWAFAALGTVWALIQLLVYNVLARQDLYAVALVWLGMLCLFALSPLLESMTSLLTVVIVTESIVLVALLGVGVRRVRRRAVEQPAQ